MEKEQVKMSYEDLERIAISLQNKVQEQEQLLNRMSDITLYKRLDYLFKIIEFKDSFPQHIVDWSGAEVHDLMFGKPKNVSPEEEELEDQCDKPCCDMPDCCPPPSEDMSCPSEFIGDSPNA